MNVEVRIIIKKGGYIDNLPVVSFSKWNLFGKPAKTKCKREEELCKHTHALRTVAKDKSLAVRCDRGGGGMEVYKKLKAVQEENSVNEDALLYRVQLMVKTEQSFIGVSLITAQIMECEHADGDDFYFKVRANDVKKHYL